MSEKENNPPTQTSDDAAISQIATYVLRRNNILTNPITKIMYVYDNGIYVPLGENQIQEHAVMQYKDKYTARKLKDLVSFIQGRTFDHVVINDQRIKVVENKAEICFNNGVYNVNEYVLKPHDPSKFFLSKIPVNFNPTKTCPKTTKFLNEICFPEDIPAIFEILGYCLLRDYPIEKTFMFLGSGGNGKSTLLELFGRFLGSENVVAHSLQSLEIDSHAKADLYGKHANIFADLTDSELKHTSTFKMLTGNDLIQARFLYKNSFNFRNHAKPLFSANKLPKSQDDSDAFFRRWIIITFPNTFSGENKRKKSDIIAELTTDDELSGLLNEALEGLKRLLKSGEFSNSKSTEQIKDEYIKKSNSVEAFANEHVEEDIDGYVSKTFLYDAYLSYCRENTIIPLSKKKFAIDLKSCVSVVSREKTIDGKRTHTYQGIKLKNTLHTQDSLDIVTQNNQRHDNENISSYIP